MSSQADAAPRPLRADAERNRQRILNAAGELFAAKGLSVGLDEIARHAGVGVATAYRRYPDKEQLIRELFEERLGHLVARAEQALADAVEQTLRENAPHLEVLRDGDTVIARTQRGLAQRVLLAGHLDTVPLAGNLPSSRRFREGR